MVRLLVFIFCLGIGIQGLAADPIYFSVAEKALISLLLKTAGSTADTKLVAGRLKRTTEQLQISSNEDPEIVSVKSFDEFIAAQKAELLFNDFKLDEVPDAMLLKKLRRTTYTSPSLRVMKKIENYEAMRVITFQKSLSLLGIKSLELAEIQRSNVEDIRSGIKKSFNEKVDRLTASLSEKNTAEVVVLSKLLKSYFKNLPVYQQNEILYRVSQMPLNSNTIDMFLVMIQSAGPQLQKLVQIMGRSDQIPDEFKIIFQKLESQVKPVPWWKIERTLVQNGVELKKFIYFERSPIGVGTMAQTHRAQYYDEAGQRQNAVIRILKPGIEKDLEMDHQVLIRAMAEIDADAEVQKFNIPSLSDLVEDLHNSVVEELNFVDTVKNQKKARKVYQREEVIAFNGQKNTLQFNVPRTEMFASKDVMIQDLVFGKKPAKEFANYAEIYPDLYRSVSEKVATVWLEEAFFKSGFFHADLHQGNILSLYTDGAIVVNILDFGMVGQLTPQLKQSALLLALGIKLDRGDIIAENYLKLSKMNPAQPSYAKLLKLVQARIAQANLDPKVGTSLESWTAWALDQGIELNYEFLKLNRGLSAVEGMLVDSKSTLTIEKIAQAVAFKNKAFVSELLLKESRLKIGDYVKLAGKVFGQSTPQPLAVGLQCRALF